MAVRSVIIAARWSTLIAVIAHAINSIHGYYHEWWLPHSKRACTLHIWWWWWNDGLVCNPNLSSFMWNEEEKKRCRVCIRVGMAKLSFTFFFSVAFLFFLLLLAFCKFFLHCISCKGWNLCQMSSNIKFQSNECHIIHFKCADSPCEYISESQSKSFKFHS